MLKAAVPIAHCDTLDTNLFGDIDNLSKLPIFG